MRRIKLSALAVVVLGLFLFAPGGESVLRAQTGEMPLIAARQLFVIEADFLHPSDVAIGLQGRIYVLDGVNNRVAVFTSTGKFVSAFVILTAVLAGCSAIPWSLNAKTITPSDNIITENRDVSGFTGVNMETIGKVTLSQGDSESLVIEGPENLIPLVKTSVRNGVLVIEIPEKVNIRSGGSGNLLTFSISLLDLTDLTVSGIGTVEMDALNTDSLKLLMSGAGAVLLDQLSVANADINMSGLGEVTLAGSATSATLDISGAGAMRLRPTSSSSGCRGQRLCDR